LKELGPNAKVNEAMVHAIPTIDIRHRLDEAFRLLQEKSAPAVGVIDASGRLAGLITSETIGQMLLVKDALPKGSRLGPWSRPAGA
jgi:predicted transcriptional regulator